MVYNLFQRVFKCTGTAKGGKNLYEQKGVGKVTGDIALFLVEF